MIPCSNSLKNHNLKRERCTKRMGSEKEFLEKLKELLDIAAVSGNRITTEEVGAFFGDSELSEEQMLLVYDYLLTQKISVVGYMKGQELTEKAEKETAAAYTPEEKEYLEEYRRELSGIRPAEAGERERLFEAAAAGDGLAKSRLTELYLMTVLGIAEQMHTKEVFLGDLVQEGNVSLLLALDLLDGAENAEAFLLDEIRQGMAQMIEERQEQKRCDRKMEQQVNHLDDTLHQLADEKGRAVTIDELAKYMKMSEEEILDIMKLAGEDLYEKYKKTDDKNPDDTKPEL